MKMPVLTTGLFGNNHDFGELSELGLGCFAEAQTRDIIVFYPVAKVLMDFLQVGGI